MSGRRSRSNTSHVVLFSLAGERTQLQVWHGMVRLSSSLPFGLCTSFLTLPLLFCRILITYSQITSQLGDVLVRGYFASVFCRSFCAPRCPVQRQERSLSNRDLTKSSATTVRYRLCLCLCPLYVCACMRVYVQDFQYPGLFGSVIEALKPIMVRASRQCLAGHEEWVYSYTRVHRALRG